MSKLIKINTVIVWVYLYYQHLKQYLYHHNNRKPLVKKEHLNFISKQRIGVIGQMSSILNVVEYPKLLQSVQLFVQGHVNANEANLS
jgi:hypothetical protein